MKLVSNIHLHVYNTVYLLVGTHVYFQFQTIKGKVPMRSLHIFLSVYNFISLEQIFKIGIAGLYVQMRKKLPRGFWNDWTILHFLLQSLSTSAEHFLYTVRLGKYRTLNFMLIVHIHLWRREQSVDVGIFHYNVWKSTNFSSKKMLFCTKYKIPTHEHIQKPLY